MKKVLFLDTSIATSNIGDEIINISIKNNFPEIFNDNYIYNLPTHTRTFTWYQKLIYKKRMSLYEEADYKFLCGTNALYTNMLRPMPTWNINIFNYGLFKNTICLGVGLGVNSKKVNFYTKFLYKKVLSSEFVHSVRDENTKSFLEKLGFKAINTGCPTLWGMDSMECEKIPTKKADRCIFTLTNYHSDVINDKLMIDIIKSNYSEIYFWPQCLEDIDYFKQLDRSNSSVHLLAPNIDAYENILLAGDIDYIGNRLHGGIYALQHAVRTIIISIDYRAEEMSKDFSLQCIKRSQIKEKLNEIINSNWSTSISELNTDKINKWKKQFVNSRVSD